MNRKWRTHSLLLSTCLLIALLGSSDAFAQFSKYKSKTKFDRGNLEKLKKDKKSIKSLLAKKPRIDDEEEEEEVQEQAAQAAPPKEPSQKLVRPTVQKAADKQDIFGRGTGIISVKKGGKDSKYVNLNPETAFGPEVVTSFDFPNTTLMELTKHMQKLTGINLILAGDVKGKTKISILAPTAITVGDAWKAYLTALNMNGFTLVKSGAFYKIVSARDIRYTPTKIYTGSYSPDTENFVMKIIPVKNIKSSEIVRAFRPFMGRNGRLLDIKQTNTVIIQDMGTNVNRVSRLIKFVDVPGHEETLQIIPVKHSSAQEIAKILQQIIKTTGKKARRATDKGENIGNIMAEPRTNSIIAMANANGAKQLRSLINKLDVESITSSSGKIHVYYLNFGDSETLAKTLQGLVSSSKPKGKSRFSKTADPIAGLFDAEVKITADKSNNALVVTASQTDYLTIKEVIKKLDVARDQVYLEGLIMETQIAKGSAFGISIVGAYGAGNAKRAGFTGSGGGSDLINLLTGNITSLGGLFVGAGLGKAVTQTLPDGSTQEINTVNGLVTAIATDSNSNVLATPQLLAMDNEEAVFEVGETVPKAEKTDAANGSSSVSITQQKVALTLKFTPQINRVTRFIKLKIDQKIEDFSDRQLPESVAGQGVATTTRSAQTVVIARDRDTIAMGGLMRDKEGSTVSKVPILGDIPILGWLFKHRRKENFKVNLLFFLTPRILDTFAKSAKTTKDLLNRRAYHLKDSLGEDDPFGSTVKGLYEKARQQEKRPDEIMDQDEVVHNPNTDDVPNYTQIIQKVKTSNAAVAK